MQLRAFRVRELMARQKIRSQTELAERVGVSQNTVTSWLAGETFPEQSNLQRLREVLSCTEYDIVQLDGEPQGKALALAAPLPQMVSAAA